MSEKISTDALLRAILSATEEQREQAARILRGETPVTSPPQIEAFLTLREVSHRLNIHTSTLWRWNVPGHDLGGRRRFRISEILAYLESPQFKSYMATLLAERREQRAVHQEAVSAEVMP